MYRLNESPSEIELVIEDDTPEAVLTEALVALGDVLSETRGGTAVTHEVSIEGPDLATLLTGWIEELVALAERDGFICERVLSIELEPNQVEAKIGGERSVPQSSIKAVTCEHLELERDDGVWRARLVLDL